MIGSFLARSLVSDLVVLPPPPIVPPSPHIDDTDVESLLYERYKVRHNGDRSLLKFLSIEF